MPQIVKTADLGTFEFADSWGTERIESFLADKRDAVRRAKALDRENPIKRETEKTLLRAKLLRLKAQRRMVEDDLAKEYVTETLARQKYPAYDAFSKLYENVLPKAGPPSAGVRYLLGGAPRAVTSLPSLGLSLIPTETTQGWSRGLDAFAQRAAEAVKPATYELGVQDSPGHGFGLMFSKGVAEMPYYLAAGGSARGILGALAKRAGPSGLGGRALGRLAGPRTATAIGSHPMLAQEHRQEGRARGVEMPYWSALTAIPSALIETISTGKMLSRTLTGAGRKALGKAGGKIPQGVKDFSGMAVREGLEEGAQEAIAIKTPELAGAAALSPQETLSRIGSAVALGGILGGMVGGIQSASLNRRNTKVAKSVYEQLGKELHGSRTFRTMVENTIANTKDLDDETRSVLRSAMKKASKGEEATDLELIGFYNLVKKTLGPAYNLAGVYDENNKAVKEIEQEKAGLGSALELFKKIERNQGAGKIESPVEEAGEGSPGGTPAVAAGVSGEVQVPTREGETQEGPKVYGYVPTDAQDAVAKRNELRPGTVELEVAEEKDFEVSSVLRGALEAAFNIKVVPVKTTKGVYGKKDGKEDDDGPDAFVDPAIANTIFISTEKRRAGSAHNPVLSLIGHEATHIIKQNDPDTYRELKEEIHGLVEAGYGTQRLIKRYKKVWGDTAGVNLDDDAAFEEFVADFVADSFVDPRFWDKLSDSNPAVFNRLAEKVYDYLGKVGERIFDLLQNRQLADNPEQRATISAALKNERENVEKVRTVIANALLRYQKRMETAKYAGEREGPLEDPVFSPQTAQAAAYKLGAPKMNSEWGFGKKMGKTTYWHRDYTGQAPPEVRKAVDKATASLPADTNYDTLAYNADTGAVTFFNVPEFDSVDEPSIHGYSNVSKSGQVKTVAYKNPDKRPIYHHKWQWVKSDRPGYEGWVARSVDWQKYVNEKKVPRSKIGQRAYWDEEVVPNVRSLYATPKQEITSERTPRKQAARTAAAVDWKPGTVNFDQGAGPHNDFTDKLKGKGVENLPYDPFTRSREENEASVARARGGQVDTSTANNLLNVIKEKENRADVIEQAADAVKADGTSYFLIHQGDKSGKGKVTKDGWQNNRMAKDYVSEIKRWFDEVTVNGNLITARKPKKGPSGKATRYSPKEPLWRSRLKDTVAEMDFGKDKAETAQSWKGKLAGWAMGKGLPPGRGISSEEVEASGLSDWLDARGNQKTTREHVLAYLEENTPWLEESVKVEGKKRDKEWFYDQFAQDYEAARVTEEMTDDGGFTGRWEVLADFDVLSVHDTEQEARDELDRIIRLEFDNVSVEELNQRYGSGDVAGSGPQFPQPDLRTPGGRNYIERLLIAKPKMGTGTFTEGHWPNNPNVMVHSRSQSFDLPNGELLHLVDEAQSDLHAEGRKRGYYDPKKELERIKKLRADLEVAKQKEDELWDEYEDHVDRVRELIGESLNDAEALDLFAVILHDDGLGAEAVQRIEYAWKDAATRNDSIEKAKIREVIPKDVADPFVQARREWEKSRRAYIQLNRPDEEKKPVPDMPWKKTWARTVFRRELRAAVDKGADWFAWTTGKTQRDRYNLSRWVSKLVYEPAKEELTGYDKTGQRVFRDDVPEAKMVSYVGKGVAEKLLNAPVQGGYQFIEGKDLEVGGLWTTALYDERYVSDVKKLIKGTGQTVQSKVLVPADTDIEAREVQNFEKGWAWEVRNKRSRRHYGVYKDKAEADAKVEELIGEEGKVHAVRLTPEVNERFGTAQSLFSPGETKTQTLINKFNRTRLVTATEARGLLGDEFPEYLNEVIAFMSRQRKKLDEGKMTVRDVAKAYVMTLGSIQAQWQQEVLIEGKTGFTAPVSYTAKNDKGQTMLRPEEAVAAWLGTDIGQRALNDIEKGIVNIPAWNQLVDLRGAYGQHQLDGAVAEQRTQLNLHDLQQVTKEINDAKNDPGKLDEAVKKLAGIRNAKSPFLQALVGVGAAPTIDAVEFNFWLTGQGNIRHLNTSKAKFAREIKANIRNKRISGVVTERISKKIKALAKEYSSDHRIPPEHAAHIIHHWLWDRAKGTETPHTGMMEAMEKFSPEESFRIKARSLKKEFETNHAVDIVGQSAKNVAEVAALAQFFRDPRKEVFRWIFTKEDKIVGQYAATARMVNSTWPVASGDTYESISVEANLLGADGYYIQHNHPSGKPDPSVDDLQATRRIASSLSGFKGHIVINHDKYVVIDSNADYTTHDVPGVGTKPDPTRDYRGELRILNREANVPAKVVEMAKEMQVHQESDLVQYFVVNTRLTTVALAESTLKDFLEHTYSQFDHLRNLAKEEGGRHVVAYYGGLSVAFLRRSAELVDDGFLLDGVKGRHDGTYRSVQEHMGISHMEDSFIGRMQPATNETTTRYSPTEADTEYANAVREGDTDKAEAMVDEAAKKAGYTTGPVYHYSPTADQIKVFDRLYGLRIKDDKTPGIDQLGVWFKQGKGGEADYGPGRIDAYLKLDDPFVIEGRNVGDEHPFNQLSKKIEVYGGVEGFRDRLKSQGWDGVVMKNVALDGSVGHVYVALEPEQIKSADPVTRDDVGNVIPLSQRFDAAKPDIRYSPAEPVPVFYSKLQRGVDKVLPKAAKRMKKVSLRKGLQRHGVTQKEMVWSGFDELLSGPEESVTRKEIEDALARNGMRIREAVYESELHGEALEKKAAEIVEHIEGNNRWRLRDPYSSSMQTWATREEAMSEARIVAPRMFDKQTLHDLHSTRGGKRYRELLLILPERKGVKSWYTNHWPKDRNVVVHVRFSEFVDRNGDKVLMIEEIQSDWAQAGRKVGYGRDRHWYVEDLATGRDLDGPFRTEAEANEVLAKIENKIGTRVISRRETPIPDQPFKDSTEWTALAVKRMLRWAADNDFDRLAWTKGYQQFKRYGTDLIAWQKSGDGWKIYVKDYYDPPDSVLKLSEEEQAARLFQNIDSEVVNNYEEFERFIAKKLRSKTPEQRKKLKERTWRKMNERDSGISAPRKEGMEGYYDGIVWTVVKKLARKTPQTMRLDLFGRPEDRWVVREKHPDVTVTHRYFRTKKEAEDLVKELNEAEYHVLNLRGNYVSGGHYGTIEEAEAHARRINGTVKFEAQRGISYFFEEDVQPVHSVEVAAGVKKDAKREGFSLFSPAEAVDAEYAKAVEADDMAKAQEMVDAAAITAGYTIETYRGDSDDWDDFRNRRESGIFTSQDKDFADQYGKMKGAWRGVTRRFYVKGKVLDLERYDSQEWIREWAATFDQEDWVNRKTGEVEDPVDAVASGQLFDWEGDWSGKMWTDLQRSARADGYDVLIAPDSAEAIDNPVATIVLDDNGIKLADPVTYDDDGNVIPLSRRFDDTGYDVRYSPKEADEDYFEAVKAGDLGRVQDMVDRAARTAGFPRMELTHGTTHRFTVFNLSRANVENDLGAGFYFTNTPDDATANYSRDGADLTARVEMVVDQMTNDSAFEEFEEKRANGEIPESMSLEEYIRKLAEEQVVGPEDREIKAYVKLNNPAILGLGQDETFLTYEIDEETGEESGTFVDFIRAFRDVVGAFEGAEEDVVVRELYEAAMDHDGISMRDAIAVMKDSGGLDDAIDYDNDGKSLSAEVVRQTIEEAGYDGIVDRTVFAKFGPGMRRGIPMRGMAGMNPYTIHVIAFEPHQIKSSEPITRDDQGNIIPLSQRFNEENPDYRYSPQEVAHSRESLDALDPENARTERLKIKANLALITEKFENEWKNLELALDVLPEGATPNQKFDAMTDRKAATLTRDVGKVLAQIELVNQMTESGAMDDLVSNVEREKLRAVAYAVTAQSKVFEDLRNKLKYQMENVVSPEFEAALEALQQDLPVEKARTAFHESLANDLVRDYKAYLDKQLKGSKDRPFRERVSQLIRDFSHKMRGDREAHQQIRTLFNHIALGNPKVTDAILNDPDIAKNSRTFYKWLEENGIVTEALQTLYRTNKGKIGYAQDITAPGPKGGASRLASYASLVSRIKTLRGLERKETQTKHEVQQFASDFFGGQVKHGAKGVKGPPGKRANVTPKQMANAYFKARKAKEEHAERARQIDKRYKRAEYRFEGLRKAIEFLDGLANDPTYKEQRNRAIEQNGWHFGEEMKIVGNTIQIRLPGEPVEKPMIIKLTANGDLIKAEADKLREVERKMASWVTDAEANKYMLSREEMGLLATRQTILREVQDRLNPRWSVDGDVQSIPLLNLTSGVAGKAFSLPYVRLLFELPQELADSIPGQLGRDFKRAYDDLNYLNQEFRAHFTNTKFKLVIAIDEAIKSHGFKGIAVRDHFNIWEKAVLEPILNSDQNSQSITRMRVGTHLYSTELDGFKDTVTKEDIAAAKAMHAYEAKIHQLASNTLGKKEYRRLNNPLRIIQDEKLFEQGGVVTRAPIQTGRLTMSRRMQKFASEILGSWWDESKIGYARGKEERGPVVADPKAARELHEEWLMDTDADGSPRHAAFFNYILMGYINEGNPELAVRRKSEQAKIYDHILREIMGGRKFQNTEEVVERIAALRGTMLDESDIDLDKRKQMAAKVLFDEIEKVTTDMLEAHHPFLKQYVEDSVNVNVQNPKDSFNKARGKLLGPSILYDHALSNDEDMKALQNSALNHFFNRAVDATERVVTAVKEETQRLEADLKEMRGRMSYKERLTSKGKEYRAKSAKLMELNRRLSRSADHLNQLRAIPRNDDESLGRRRGMAFVRGVLASTVLSPWLNVLSPAADYFSTNVFWNPLMMMHLAALQGLWLHPTKFFAKEVGKGFIRMFRNAGLDIARRARDKKVVGEWVKSMTSLAPAILEFEALRNEAVAKGLMKRPAIQDQMEALRRTGRIEGFVNEPTTPDNRGDTVKAVERMAVWFEQHVGVRLRGWRDEMELVNVVGQMQAVSSGLKSMKKLAQEVYAQRELNGVPEDHPLTPKEMRMIPESFERWRDLFGSVAAMETVFADYYQKTKGLSEEEAMKLPLGRDEAEADALTRATMMMGALVNAPSLTPVITQRRDLVGGTARTLTFLMGWANRARYQVGRTPLMSSISKEREYPEILHQLLGVAGISKERSPEILRQLLGATWMLIGLAVLAGFGSLPTEFKEWLRKWITGQPSAQIRLSQLIRRADTWDVAKYGISSYAANMPMIGNRIASFLGTRTYSYGSLFDMSDHVFMLGSFRNMGIAATKAWQTGDIGTSMKDYARRQIPNLQFFINRWDAGDADARSASRVLRAIAPSGTEVASARGGYYKQTPMTMAARHLMAAGMTGDTKRIAEAYEALVQAHMDAGKSREDAEDAADRQVSAMSPERRAFGRYLTPGERSRVFEAASPEEQALIERASGVRKTIKRSLGRGVTISKPRGVRFGSTGGRAPRKVPGLPSLDLRGSLRLPALTLD